MKPTIILLHLFLSYIRISHGRKAHEKEIVLRISGNVETARRLAEEMGYEFAGSVRNFPNTYVFIPYEDDDHIIYDKRGSNVSKRLADDQRVIWFEHQEAKSRQKRDFVDPSEIPHYRVKRTRKLEFNDELWDQQWYLQDTRTRIDLPKLDLNVLPVYRAGITGRNIRISILDDGIEHTHKDLKSNYDPDISYDCNEDDHDPLPRYEPHKQNSHGTRCAGEIAMMANNGKCGVGIAFNSKIGGVKILDGLVNDRIEGTALGYAQDLVDIYSASWGPNDDGKTVDGPGRLAREAMERGIREGRKGKGTIFVWASGNGGSLGDNCNCDGYLASPYTVSIGSASQKGEFPWYGEACASTLAVTYSSGAYQDQMIATTDLHNECTIKHTGTSASAPLAAGIIALALETNPDLTWRDVQHLIVWTSELAPVGENPGWQMNTAGLWFNTKFGFGLMNAFGLVRAAANWTNVPLRKICTTKSPDTDISFGFGDLIDLEIETDACRGTSNEVNYLEHVEIRTTIEYSVRGALEAHLVSPTGTKVQLLAVRKLDKSKEGFKDWSFMSVMTWGEMAKGKWRFIIEDKIGPSSNKGKIVETTLIIHGTQEMPYHMIYGKRVYNHNYNRVHNRLNVLKDYENEMYKWLMNNDDYWNTI